MLYDADSEVTVDAFMPHMHPGGEAYLVLEGEVWVMMALPNWINCLMDRETTHTPKTRGKTLILVLWPEGVKATYWILLQVLQTESYCSHRYLCE